MRDRREATSDREPVCQLRREVRPLGVVTADYGLDIRKPCAVFDVEQGSLGSIDPDQVRSSGDW